MAFDDKVAQRVRNALSLRNTPPVTEKKMFGGLAFLVDDKMCINVSGERLMCRFDAARTEDLSARKGYLPVEMSNRLYKGYCYVEPVGFKSKRDFEFWLDLCLEFNAAAKSSKT